MDDVIQYVYGFSRGTIGYRYVRYCLKHQVIIKPWRYLRVFEPSIVPCSMVCHLARAVDILEHNHHNFTLLK